MASNQNPFSPDCFPPRTLEDCVFAVLCFFDIFDHPLTLKEVNAYLIGKSDSLNQTGLALMAHEKVDFKDGFFFLQGREEIVQARKVRETANNVLWNKVSKFVPLLRVVPYIRMVAVCNNLALGTADSGSDIDLFIVTKRGRIFTGRILSSLLFELIGLRRKGSKIAGRFCMSFFANENNLNFEKLQKKSETDSSMPDIYLMYWILTLKPIFGSEGYKRFVRENLWIKKYFPNWNGYITEPENPYAISRIGSLSQELLLNNLLGDFVESGLNKWHTRRLDSRRASLDSRADVCVNEDMLKFHNVDRRSEYNSEFFKKYSGIADWKD